MHRLVFLSAVLAASLLGTEPAAAQIEAGREWTVRRWTTENGLSQNSVNAIVETRDGFLWIGTFGGLARFDGIEFDIFDLSNAPELGDARILSLTEAPDGALWIGTEDAGIIRMRDGTFEQMVSAEVARNVFHLHFDGAGLLWATADGGVLVIDPVDGGVTERTDLESSWWFGVTVDPAGNTWAATSTRLRRVAPGLDSEAQSVAELGLKVRPWSAGADSRGNIFLGLRDRIVRIDPETGANDTIAVIDGGPDSLVVRVLTPGPNESMIAVGVGGAVIVDSAGDVREIPIRIDGSFPRVVRTAHVDREGSIWMGSRGDGLIRIRPAAVRPPVAAEGRGRSETVAIAAGPDGRMWTSDCLRLSIHESPNTAPQATVDAPDGCLTHLAVGRLETWVRRAAGYGVMRLDRTGNPVESLDHAVTQLLADDTGDIWFMDVDEWIVRGADGERRFPAPTGSEAEAPTHVQAGWLWQQVDRALLRWPVSDPSRSAETVIPNLPGDLRWMHTDERGVVWVATYGGGLTRIEGSSFVRIGREEGLPETFISAILPQGEHLWLHGNRTLTRVERDELDAVAAGTSTRVTPIVLGEADGFREASGAHAATDAEGRIWIGTIDGTLVLETELIGEGRPTPNPAIEHVLHDGTEIVPGEVIPPMTREVEIRFTAPTFVRPERLRFQYRLLGLSDEWSEPTQRRSAFFTTLDPRSYTFEVRAVTEDGIVSASPAQLQFGVQPALWQSWWFRLLGSLAFVTAVAMIVRLLTNAERRRSTALRREIRERKRLEVERQELSRKLLQAQKLEAVGRLTGGIAHDFNNLLLVITASLEMARDSAGDESTEESIDTAMSAAFRGGALTQQLLAFSRRGEMRHRVTDVAGVIRGMDQMLARSLGEPYPVRIEVEHQAWSCVTDPDGLQNVLLNLAINARDSMPEGGPITISAMNVSIRETPPDVTEEVRPGDYLRVSVRDQGTGIDDADLEHIFDPFFTTKEVGRGTGLGLSTVHGFAGQTGGFVQVETEVGRGTTISVYLPRATRKDVGKDERDARPELGAGTGESILLVEDNERVRTVTANLMRSFGYRVQEAGETETARQLLREEMPDLLLTDILLPGESGVEFAVRMRRKHPDLPILLATGFAPEGLREAVHGFEVLEKPYTGAQLSRAIVEALAGRRRDVAVEPD